MASDYWNVEKDQILVPAENNEYKAYSLLNLLNLSDRRLRSVRNFGLAPLHFITQRGPQQDGETPLDMRLDTRTIQIALAETLCDRTTLWDRRNDLLDLLRPSRSFNGEVRPLIYRKWLPAGHIEQGSDGESDGANTFTSDTGRFITRGGLDAGAAITIGGTAYTITSVPNDYTLTLSSAPGAATNLQWSYQRRYAKRDLYCLLSRGPTFDQGPGASPFIPTGYNEVLRFIAHDPVWYGEEQTETFSVPDEIGDLVFDGAGAWFGAQSSPGTGRWLFAVNSIITSARIVYWGTDGALPTIEVSGPADSFTITNNTTGRSISYSTSIATGTTITVDLVALTVTDNLGNNQFAFADGDLSLFSLSPAPQAPNRVNSLSVNVPNATVANTTVTIKWKNRFIGI